MDDGKPEAAVKSTATTSSSNSSGNNTAAVPPAPALRHRASQRLRGSKENSPSPRRPQSSPLARRRSSLISYSSLEDIREAFAKDIVDPRTTSARNQIRENEVTHWHSTPLAFALLPALGGLFFRNGKAFTSDILLLGLAAIFLNWSIRLPWDWYYSAQSVRQEVEREMDTNPDSHVDDDTDFETASVGESSSTKAQDSPSGDTQEEDETGNELKEHAISSLQTSEMMALGATFVFPAVAAYLLHVIRGALSTASTGLVSDYNLSIFLLAAEIRPCRQLTRLIANRTMHLQRIVAGADHPFASSVAGKGAISDLTSRISELEAKLGSDSTTPISSSVAQKADVSELSAELRKRYEPRLEGLERAVRRYEKRTTTLAITVEQRLQNLEHRIQEAVSLAAVAAHHSRDRSALSKLMYTISTVMVWPVRTAWTVAVSPVLLLEDLYERLKTLLLGTSSSPRAKQRKDSKQDAYGANPKLRDKATTRRVAK